MDSAIARHRAAAVDRLVAGHGGESSARLPNEDRGRAYVVWLDPRIDHAIGPTEKNLPITIEVRVASRRIAGIGQPGEGMCEASFGELLEGTMHHGRIAERGHFRNVNGLPIVRTAVSGGPDEQVLGRGHVSDADHWDPFRLDPEQHRPGWQASDERARSVDRINDDSERWVVAVAAGLFAIEFRVWVVLGDVLANHVLDFAICRGHGASIRLRLCDDAAIEMFPRDLSRLNDPIGQAP